MGFDLETIDLETAAEQAQELRLLHPVKGTELGITIMVVGADSRTYRQNLRTIRDKAMENAKTEPTDPDEAEFLSNARLAAAAMVDWTGVEYGGETVPFTIDNAIEVMRKRQFVAHQVSNFRDRRGNFFKA